MPRHRFLVVVFATSAMLLGAAAAWSDEFDFRAAVGPLLAKRCASCHDGAEKKGGLDLTTRETALAGGDSGPALVPNKVDDSLLWQRVADDEMPPKHPLKPDERQLLKDWIARGAPWSGGALDPLEFTTEQRAGYDWWSLRPIAESAPPSGSSWVRNPIDAFIEQRLKSARLEPSPEADARTLVRRLYFGLTGLPPDFGNDDIRSLSLSPALPLSRSADEERESGRTGEREKAYEALVERLLASPAYGERWARHWLDVVRFGESQGFERDKLRTNSWRYRDWVIDAFNRDLPYDEFARLQLAGDVLRPNDAEAIVATGFLVAGPWDEVGQQQQSAAMKVVVRQDELEDLVGTVGQTFLGLTVNCARCHDHKFDPIRQAEYYRLTAALGGVHHGEPNLPKSDDATQAATLRAPLEARRGVVQKKLDAMEGPHRRAILAARKAAGKKVEPPRPIAAWDFDGDGRDSIGDLHLEFKDGPFVRQGRLLLEAQGYAVSPVLKRHLAEKTLEAWVQIDDVEQRGGGLLGVQSLDGEKFDTITVGERQPKRWLAGSNTFRRSKDLEGPDEAASKKFVQIAIAYHADGTIAAYRDGRPYGKSYPSLGLTVFPSDTAQVIVGLRHSPSQPGKLFRGAVDKARLYDRALTAEEVAISAGRDTDFVDEKELTAKLTPDERAERGELRFELDQLKQLLARVDDVKAYAVAPKTPEAAFVLHRGNPNDRREPALPGGIASLKCDVTADFGLTAEANDAERRKRLAAWITDRQNPLFARVIVNRLWHYHFGVGLVDTPNDFGFNGGRPSHPELLDWLARELIEHDWSLKHIQRLIVTSATYRQSSRYRPDAAKIDAGNRLLWRKSPMRLEAETLRDALLQFAGKLDRTMHGPGFYEFTTFVRNSQFYDMRDPLGDTFQRRTIYRTWVRSARSQMLDVFDCPDPSTKTPQRAVTTTPLQALSLLNNSFVLRMAGDLATRVEREVGDDRAQQVRQVFQHVLSREPDETETAASVRFVNDFGLAAFCRVLFNGNELLYVD